MTLQSETRRKFIAKGLTASVAAMVVPSRVLGRDGNKPPSEKLNIAAVGLGGQGTQDVSQLAGENIVALCDVDSAHAGGTFKKYPKAKIYTDFRKMLETQKDIDAVVVATPDHLHAPVSLAAIRLGKHVYCEKPLTHSVWEAQFLRVGRVGSSGFGFRPERCCSGMVRQQCPTGKETYRTVA